ncbi:TraR/DksA C4-type zinc finger protein [Acidiferrimicrobium sp. IK]|uniref:TraR/DksA family transcriptional regulator n=1 Tax=Acidiferrimicrobium sp. IK TaxID=2871700 RepID=UPI0021CB8E88|nr:TraR/DksA C4-type zinc finger protein [Acidiferrimicrobium sp. IK]MCU4184739.1 TraR/DksA C4-type zinc finger protein [Acidiferrimicrobium sp. IK]
MMADTGVAALRNALETERAALRRELNELGALDGTGALDYDANFADSSQVNAERGETGALVAKLRSGLDDVELALAKLDGTATPAYGICERCGQPIAEARLEAMPTARRCVTCSAAG